MSHLANKRKIFFNEGDKSQILSIPSAKKETNGKKNQRKKRGMNSPSNPSYCKSVHRYTESFMTTLVTYQRCVSKMCIHILLREENLFSARSSPFGLHEGRKLSHCSSSVTALYSGADLPQTSFSRSWSPYIKSYGNPP